MIDEVLLLENGWEKVKNNMWRYPSWGRDISCNTDVALAFQRVIDVHLDSTKEIWSEHIISR